MKNTKLQIKKNIVLSGKLIEYLSDHPDLDQDDVSYIIFTTYDEQLNEFNEEVLKSIVNEGKKVIRATNTKDQNHPWQFIPA